MIRFVIVPSDMSGKPIAGALAKTFPGDYVKVVNLADAVVTDYGSDEAEELFRSFDSKIDEVIFQFSF